MTFVGARSRNGVSQWCQFMGAVRLCLVVLVIGFMPGSVLATARGVTDAGCAPLKAFVSSVKPDEKRVVLFRTSWFEPFKDEPNSSNLGGQRCEHGGYGPAKTFCDMFMKKSSTEFAGSNAVAVIQCLAPGVSFGRLQLTTVDVFFSCGTDDRGQNIQLTLDKDEKTGGMLMRLEVDGY